MWRVGHHEGAGHGIPRIRAFGFWQGVCHTGTGRSFDTREHSYVTVGHDKLVMGQR